MDVTDIATIAERSTFRFRLETQPTYLVEQEADDFAAWRRGDRTLPTPEANAWLRNIRDTTAAGARWMRVRILDYPLTDYAEFELHGYQANAAAGELINVADRAWDPELKDLRDDFWMFDDTAVRMVYDDAGRFVRAEQPENNRPFLGVRAVAFRHSVPLDVFLPAREPRLIA
jgi:hypothetical protein